MQFLGINKNNHELEALATKGSKGLEGQGTFDVLGSEQGTLDGSALPSFQNELETHMDLEQKQLLNLLKKGKEAIGEQNSPEGQDFVNEENGKSSLNGKKSLKWQHSLNVDNFPNEEMTLNEQNVLSEQSWKNRPNFLSEEHSLKKQSSLNGQISLNEESSLKEGPGIFSEDFSPGISEEMAKQRNFLFGDLTGEKKSLDLGRKLEGEGHLENELKKAEKKGDGSSSLLAILEKRKIKALVPQEGTSQKKAQEADLNKILWERKEALDSKALSPKKEFTSLFNKKDQTERQEKRPGQKLEQGKGTLDLPKNLNMKAEKNAFHQISVPKKSSLLNDKVLDFRPFSEEKMSEGMSSHRRADTSFLGEGKLRFLKQGEKPFTGMAKMKLKMGKTPLFQGLQDLDREKNIGKGPEKASQEVFLNPKALGEQKASFEILGTNEGMGEKESLTRGGLPSFESLEGKMAPSLSGDEGLLETNDGDDSFERLRTFERVKEQLVKLVNKDLNKKLDLVLQHEDLGEILLQVKRDGGENIKVSISLSGTEALEFFKSHQGRLAHGLQSAGVKLADLQIDSFEKEDQQQFSGENREDQRASEDQRKEDSKRRELLWDKLFKKGLA